MSRSNGPLLVYMMSSKPSRGVTKKTTMVIYFAYRTLETRESSTASRALFCFVHLFFSFCPRGLPAALLAVRVSPSRFA